MSTPPLPRPQLLHAMETALEAQVAEFHRQGFVCLRGCLSAAQCAQLSAVVDRSRATAPGSWELRGPGAKAAGWRPLDEKDGGSAALAGLSASHAAGGGGPPAAAAGSGRALEIAVGEAGRYQTHTNHLLEASAEFDPVLLCPPVLRLVEQLMVRGPGLFSGT